MIRYRWHRVARYARGVPRAVETYRAAKMLVSYNNLLSATLLSISGAATIRYGACRHHHCIPTDAACRRPCQVRDATHTA